jgi:cell division protein FtsI/penicillin-binding protein 2
LVVAAVLAFIFGAARGGSQPPARDAADRFARAWARGAYAEMYAELSDQARRRTSARQFGEAYAAAAQTATIDRIEPFGAQGPGRFQGARVVSVPLRVHTRAYGIVAAPLVLPLDGDRIAWSANLVFPGLQPGQHLERRPEVPPRAPLLGRTGAELARGPVANRAFPLGPAAEDVVGHTGRPDVATSAAMAADGFPAGALGGISGLEKAFNLRLAGQPGGDLLAAQGAASRRVLAHGEPKPARPLRTTIDPRLQQTAVAVLAGRPGGIAVLDAKDGSVRALAGSAFSTPQPPGSTFKIVTTAAALEAGAVKLSQRFPIVQKAAVGGREIANAHDEFCGGTFVQAFAKSCNSVFAPLGAKVGNERLLATAKRFGFNAKPQLFGAEATAAINPPAPSIPEPIGSDLELGVTAIGQGKLLSTPLAMGSIAQTVATGGVRWPTPIVNEASLRPRAKPVRVVSPRIAATLKQLMIAVVAGGTGTEAAITGVKVAGKTGTAELGPKPGQSLVAPPGPDGQPQPVKPEQILDAWFVGFAPAAKPRLVVSVLLANADADGGEVAAPAARQILAAGLSRGR